MRKGIFIPIRKSRTFKYVVCFMVVVFLSELVTPTASFALTSGPAQEEFASFEPVSTSDMVDLYSGDFTYNIPLLSVPGPNGGYPINIAYHSGVGMDQEASWVGLGWNLNVGAINRDLRGLPDDFKGDNIKNTQQLKDNTTVGIDFPPTGQSHAYEETFGIPSGASPTLSWQVYYNNYKGLGYRVFTSIPSPKVIQDGILRGNVGLSFDSQNGIGIEPDFSANFQIKKVKFSFDFGASINSRQGLQDVSFASKVAGSGNIKIKPKGVQAIESGTGIGSMGNSALNFSTNYGVPQVSMSMKTISFPFSIRFGTAPGFGNFKSPFPKGWSGYVSTSHEMDKGESQSSGYGYLYTTSATGSSDMKDFQRDPLPYSNRVPNLATSSFTYDLYMLTGQGTGGMFRPYASSFGILSDPTKTSQDRSYRINLEYGNTANIFHIGAGFTLGSGANSSGAWRQVNNDPDNLLFLNSGNGTGEPDFESSYFQVYGEKTGVLLNDNSLSQWGDNDAVRVKLDYVDNDGGWFNRHFIAENEFVRDATDNNAITPTTALQLYKKQRTRRGTNIETYTNSDASKFGRTKTVGYTQSGSTLSPLVKTFASPAHHVSEISVLQSDGMRYVYGIPAYNTYQKDANFAVSEPGANFNVQRVDVPNNGTEITPPQNPENGFLSQTEMPGYVHSWLLSSIHSTDYVDVTNNGPSNDDFGYWVKFNYGDTVKDYKWRVPYQQCNYSEGYKNDPTDDKGAYSYGKKDLHYLQSIETKTHIAIFYLSPRQDGLEAASEFPAAGAKGARSMCKLDSVKLFSKNDYFLAGSLTINPNAVPIKSVHFRYSYKLCPNVNNNTGNPVDINGNPTGNPAANVNANAGKLTLDTLFFTYQTSSRGKHSPYVFHYSTNNPAYSTFNMDRWGSYKQNPAPNSNNYPFVDFPYTNQDGTPPSADAWSMTGIDLPSGGQINVEYEHDDYAYVEDQRALRMFDVRGLTNGFASGSGRNDVTPAVVSTETGSSSGNYLVYFKLEKPLDLNDFTNLNALNIYYNNHYLKGVNKMYFKTFSYLKGTGGAGVGDRDYVSGYCDILPGNSGVAQTNTSSTIYDLGYVALKPVDLARDNTSGLKVSPFTRAAIEHLRVNRSELVHAPVPYSTNALAQVANVIFSIGTFANDIINAIAGFNNWAFVKGFGKDIELNGRSIIRLCDPDGYKYGGGSRVKKLTINDQWQNTTADNFEYGQTYTYTTTNETGETISSGVAYEPRVGGEESALRLPVEYTESTLLGSPEFLFVEKPLMESYYPGPSVGYSKVVVKSIAPDKAKQESGNTNELKTSAAPISVYEFYTPKDFPVIVDETDITSHKSIVRPIIIPGIYSSMKKRVARSQGYSIVLNDMAGKPKAITQLTRPTTNNPNGTIISKQEYVYHTKATFDPNKKNELSSKVQVLTSDKNYQTASIGESYDIFVDMNENLQKFKSRGLDLNLELTGPTGIPFFIVPLPYLSDLETSQRTVVTNKIIYRTGIVKEVITTTDESVIKTENIAYDVYSGEPVLTKVTNEFKDPIFNYSYAAHWFYPNMGGAYKNFGVTYSPIITDSNPNNDAISVINSTGRVPLTGFVPGRLTGEFFTVGDEVYVDYATLNSADNVYTVAQVTSLSGLEFINLIDRSGNYAPNGSVNSLKVVRSGYRNQLEMKAGNLVTKSNTVDAFDLSNPSTEKSTGTFYDMALQTIIDASAVEFSDVWQTECKNCIEGQGGNTTIGTIANPWALGIKGIWRPKRSYAYVTTRTQNNNIKEDGVFTDFFAFNWLNPSGSNVKWTEANTITKFSPYGFELENRDAIGRFSAALYEYNNSLVTVVGANSRYKELAFDAFEDYGNLNCLAFDNVDHWGFSTHVNQIVNTESHTGKYSIQVGPGQSLGVTRTLINKDCGETNVSIGVEPAPADRAGIIADANLTTEQRSHVLAGCILGCSTSGMSCTQCDSVITASQYSQYAQDSILARALAIGRPQDYPIKTIDTCDCIGQFSPFAGKKYVLSVWVKERLQGHVNPQINPLLTYMAPQVEVQFLDASNAPIGSPVTLSASGKIIEGWQRIFGDLTLPVNTAKIVVSLKNTSSGLNAADVWFDDIRIHPFDGNMVAYVYDPVTLKLVAELDANNYATLYIYDDEGQLTKVKKETIEGIKTIREGRINNVVK